jgi:hypothetical protein
MSKKNAKVANVKDGEVRVVVDPPKAPEEELLSDNSSDSEVPKKEPEAEKSELQKPESKKRKAFPDTEGTPDAFRNVMFNEGSCGSSSGGRATDPQIEYMERLAIKLKDKLGAIVPIDKSSTGNASAWIEFARDKLGMPKK